MNRYSLEVSRDLLITRAAIAGQDGTRIVRLLLDTGASYTVLPEGLLESLGYDARASGETRRIMTASGPETSPLLEVSAFRCLGQELRGFPVLCYDLPMEGYVDGLLGMDFLMRFDLAIYPKQGIAEVR